MSIPPRPRPPSRAVTGPMSTSAAGAAAGYQPAFIPPPPVDPPYYGPRNPLDPPYPGPAADLTTWSTTAVETINVNTLRNDVGETVWFLGSPPLYCGQLRTVWTIPQNVYYYVPMDTDLNDPLGMHNNIAQPEFIYAQWQGWYLCIGMMSYNTTTTGAVYDATIAVTQNSVATAWIGQQTPLQATFNPFEIVVELQSLNPATGDTVSLAGFQTTAGSIVSLAGAGRYSTLNVLYAALPSAPAGVVDVAARPSRIRRSPTRRRSPARS